MKRAVFITGIVVLAAAVAASGAFAQGPGKGQRITFEELDANGDGEITMAELEARQAARFAAVDTDGDGKLTAAELTARANARVEKRVNKMLERHDANGDGALSPDEMPTRRSDRFFDRMDADGNGTVSAEEFAEMQGKKGVRHGKRQSDQPTSD